MDIKTEYKLNSTIIVHLINSIHKLIKKIPEGYLRL
jgi:hypothetical protein